MSPLCQAAEGPEIQEICHSFNLDSASVTLIQNSWKIVNGGEWMFDFGNQEQQARRALETISLLSHGHDVLLWRAECSNDIFARVRKSARGKYA